MFETCTLKPPNEAERLASLHELDLLGGQRFIDLDRLTALAADVCNADVSALTIYNEEDGVRVSVSSGDLATGAVPRCDTICTHILLKPEPLIIIDAHADPVFSRNRFVHEPPFLRSYVGVPVGADRGLPIGILCVTHSEPFAFDHDDISRLQKIAGLVDAFLIERQARMRADRAAEKTRRERVRHDQFELIFGAVHEGVNVYGQDGRMVEANQSACDILGLTRDEMFGRTYADPRWRIVRGDGSDFPVEDFPVNRALKKGEHVRDEPMGVRLPSGETRWISINSVPVRDPKTSAVEFAVVTFKDMTLQRAAEEKLHDEKRKLAAALATAEKASRAKSDFVSVMSHELRTPMNAVMSCARLLAASKLDPVQARTLGVLEDAGRQMLALLNDLLDMSSLEAGKVRIVREPVSLVRLIEDAAVIWASEVKAKGLSLSVMIDPNLLAPRSIDPARLLQIIGNLMANAIKFTQAGSIAIQAWTERGPDGVERVAIEVEDTGPGVSSADAARIFSPFEQVDVSTTRKHGGLGLGLHVARRLAIAMGGDIELRSERGAGARFIVRVAAPPAAKSDAPVAGAEAEAHFQARDVLCVDDNPRNLFVLAAMLRAAGHRVTESASGGEALDKLRAQRFDVVLLDMVMPEMDGLEVLARLRGGDGVNQATPVVACTANVLPGQVETYSQAGTAGVLAKPIDPGALLQMVEAAARRAEANSRLAG